MDLSDKKFLHHIAKTMAVYFKVKEGVKEKGLSGLIVKKPSNRKHKFYKISVDWFYKEVLSHNAIEEDLMVKTPSVKEILKKPCSMKC